LLLLPCPEVPEEKKLLVQVLCLLEFIQHVAYLGVVVSWLGLLRSPQACNHRLIRVWHVLKLRTEVFHQIVVLLLELGAWVLLSRCKDLAGTLSLAS